MIPAGRRPSLAPTKRRGIFTIEIIAISCLPLSCPFFREEDLSNLRKSRDPLIRAFPRSLIALSRNIIAGVSGAARLGSARPAVRHGRAHEILRRGRSKSPPRCIVSAASFTKFTQGPLTSRALVRVYVVSRESRRKMDSTSSLVDDYFLPLLYGETPFTKYPTCAIQRDAPRLAWIPLRRGNTACVYAQREFGFRVHYRMYSATLLLLRKKTRGFRTRLGRDHAKKYTSKIYGVSRGLTFFAPVRR